MFLKKEIRVDTLNRSSAKKGVESFHRTRGERKKGRRERPEAAEEWERLVWRANP